MATQVVTNTAAMKAVMPYVPLVATKVPCVVLSWVSAYFAAKSIQSEYMDKVYMKESEPPSLTDMVWSYAMFQALFSALVIGLGAVVMYVSAKDVAVLKKYVMIAAIDAMVSLAATVVLLYTVASTMEKKKYFNYRYEGLRAIRALRELTFKISLQTLPMPYFAAMKV